MYSFESRVRYSETDETGVLSLLGMINYLQDCSTFQCEYLGVGMGHLRGEHLSWFISNWAIEILEMPRFGERIVISTWSYDIAKLYGWRNFTISSPDGREFVRADSLWFMFDSETGHPVKVPPEEGAPFLTQAEPRLASPQLQRKLRVEGPGRACAPIMVNEQHLDTNHHVNNAQYVEMAVAAVASLDEAFRVGRLDVQYKNAAVLGDTIVPRLHEIPDGYGVDLADAAGTTYAIVKMTHA
jgi:acyl-ACP thioesterase